MRLITRYYNDPLQNKGLLTIEDAHFQFVELNKRIADSEAQNAVELSALSSALSTQAENLSTLSSTLSTREADLSEAKSRQSLETRVVTYSAQIVALKEQLATRQAEHTMLVEQMRGQYSAQIVTLKEQLTARQAEYNVLVEQVRGQQAEIEDQRAKLKSATDSSAGASEKRAREFEYRQALAHDELQRANGQIELIKSLLLQDGAL